MRDFALESEDAAPQFGLFRDANAGTLFRLCAAILTAVAVVVLGEWPAVSVLTVVIATFVSMRKPAVGVALVVASVPLQSELPARVGPVSVTWTRILLLSLLVAWSIRLIAGREHPRISPLVWPYAAYLAALVASVLHARDLGAWAAEIYRWAAAGAVLFIAAAAVRTRNDRRWLLAALGSGIMWSFAIALYQVWTRSGPETFAQRGWLRAYGLFGEPNPFAVYLELAVLPFMAIIGVAVRKHRGRISTPLVYLSSVASLLGIATLLLTQSRGGLLGFLAGAIVILWYVVGRIGKSAILTASVAAVIGLATPPAHGIRETFGVGTIFGDTPQVSSENFAVQERLAHWGAAYRMWQAQPLVGVGAGNVSLRHREFTPVWRFRISRGHAHNNYLQAAAQAGSVGLICYLGLLVGACRHCRRGIVRATSIEQRALCIGALAVTAAVAMHGLFEYTHVLSLGISLSAVWALAGPGTAILE